MIKRFFIDVYFSSDFCRCQRTGIHGWHMLVGCKLCEMIFSKVLQNFYIFYYPIQYIAGPVCWGVELLNAARIFSNEESWRVVERFFDDVDADFLN